MNKISYKLAIYFFVIVFFIEVFLFASLYYSLVTDRANEVVNALLVRGNNHSKVLEEHYIPETLQHVSLMESQTDTGVVITSKNKKEILVQSNNVTSGMLEHINRTYEEVPLSGLIMEKHWRNEKYICTVSPIKINGELKGYVFMFQDTSYIRDLIGKMTMQFLVTFMLTIIITFLAMVFLSRRVTQPIVNMKMMTEQFAKGIYNETESFHTNDEIGDLSKVINQLGKELEELKKSRSEFLANIAHELRTPLTYIQGYLDVIIQGKFPFEKQEKYLDILTTETNNLTKLIEDLFLLARMDQNQFTIHKQQVELGHFLNNIVQRSNIAFSNKEILLEYIKNNRTCLIEMDVQRMEQVCMNVIQNAIRHSNEGGTIKVGYEINNENVIIYFKDNGEGIPEEELEKVFERFYRVNKARTRSSGGSGLGLAIIKEIVDKHNGKVSMDSTMGKGTIVYIMLPIEETS